MNPIGILKKLLSVLLISAANISLGDSLSFNHDNDLLVPSSRDQDYTAGLSLRYNSHDRPSALYLDTTLNYLDSWLIQADTDADQYSIELGLYGFTPEQSEGQAISQGDRPFASLLYYSNSKLRVSDNSHEAWHSRLSIGVLGLDLFADLQDGVHELTSSRELQGWEQQISDGGELSFRYDLSKQNLIRENLGKSDISFSRTLSLGYISEASIALAGRYGHISSPWWKQQAQLGSYGEASDIANTNQKDSYWFWGLAVKARAYNAFLQGQFRDSPVSFSSSELKHLLLEAWLGYSHSISHDIKLSYSIRGHSSEVRNGIADRNVLWGGLVISRSW